MNSSKILNSGDGTRPTTSGGVDNIGAGKRFKRKKANLNSPAPNEKKSENKKDSKSLAEDDSAPLGLTQSPQNDTGDSDK